MLGARSRSSLRTGTTMSTCGTLMTSRIGDHTRGRLKPTYVRAMRQASAGRTSSRLEGVAQGLLAQGTGPVRGVPEQAGVWLRKGQELVYLAQARPGQQGLVVGHPLAAGGQDRVRRLRGRLRDQPGALGQPSVRSVMHARVVERPLGPVPPDARRLLA